MTRHVDPPLDALDELPTPLTDGERQVVRLFDQKLPEEWEIYVQPHLNGLRPDIVVLHPRVGIAVFEIKDWDLAAMEYFVGSNRGPDILMAADKNGRMFSREAENPINKILLYERELFELYCPRLNDRAGRAVITAGLIFTASPSQNVERVFEPFRRSHEQMSKHPLYYPIVGAEQVASGDIAAIFPESSRKSSQWMTDDTAEDLRSWLREPSFSRRQRRPLILDTRQRELATTRTDTGYRRIKGPAGSGKSVVLAARASELAAEGKSVLVVSFNITLLNYLRDLAVRHVAPRQVIRRRIEFLNFHYWCKRICLKTGHIAEYDELWRGVSNGGGELDSRPASDEKQAVLDENLATLVQRIYARYAGMAVAPKYDAILVDEGQDFQPSWWQALRRALAEHGEMVLVADKTQNVYGTAAKWTEATMANAGFRGPWSELKTSYRLPPALVPHVARFAEEFLAEEEVDIPEPNQQLEMELSPVELRWVHVRNEPDLLRACDEELSRMMKRLPRDTAVADIFFLSGNRLGREFVQLRSRRSVKIRHTFQDDGVRSRRQKRAFFQGDARIKGTTVHSFKGWEAHRLIVCVESIKRASDRAVLYTALTRLLDDKLGSCLTVVSKCPALQRYGSSWPDYEVR